MSAQLQDRTGYEPLKVAFVECRTRLPAELWRALSIAERPSEGREDVAVVDVTDHGERVAVLPLRHYNTVMGRIDELERWLAECVSTEVVR